jgi:hypothetical protein
MGITFQVDADQGNRGGAATTARVVGKMRGTANEKGRNGCPRGL